MASQSYIWPVSGGFSTVTANQGTPNTDANAWPVKITDGTDVAAVNASSELLVAVSSLPLPTGAATAANQVTEIASLASIDSKLTAPLSVTGPLTDTELRATPVPVSAASLPLPTGAATAANQATEIASLASIDSKLTAPLSVTGPLTDTELRATPVPVSGPLTDIQLRASAVPVSASTLPLPTGAATAALQTSLNNKTASADVVEAYDYRDITYVGATQDISTIVYKTGGAGGTTVATQTFGYDGSNRLTSITKT